MLSKMLVLYCNQLKRSWTPPKLYSIFRYTLHVYLIHRHQNSTEHCTLTDFNRFKISILTTSFTVLWKFRKYLGVIIIQGEKSRKDTSSGKLVSAIGAWTSPKKGEGTRYPVGVAFPVGMSHPLQMLHGNYS